MNICVVGTDYAGLMAGTTLSDFGMNVICIDKDEKKIAALRRSDVSIYELGFRGLLECNVKLGRLRFFHRSRRGRQPLPGNILALKRRKCQTGRN